MTCSLVSKFNLTLVCTPTICRSNLRKGLSDVNYEITVEIFDGVFVDRLLPVVDADG